MNYLERLLLFAACTIFVPRKRTIVPIIGMEHQILCRLVMTDFLKRLEGELFYALRLMEATPNLVPARDSGADLF
jgi:hypothetical protein